MPLTIRGEQGKGGREGGSEPQLYSAICRMAGDRMYTSLLFHHGISTAGRVLITLLSSRGQDWAVAIFLFISPQMRKK